MKRFVSRSFLVLIALILGSCLFIWLQGGKIRRYEKLEMGQSREQCRSWFGHPWLEVRIGDCTCEYYSIPFWKDVLFGSSTKQHVMTGTTDVDAIRELPSEYEALQLLFDKDGKLIAYDWIGESLRTYTVAGPRDGSFDDSAEVLAALCGCEAGVSVENP